jgi:tRNA-splicing ligase RtcB
MGRVAERRSWSVVKVERTGRFEDVFCATVPETHSFTLGDNILTRNCHHNYVARERHFGQDGIIVTRKGAVRAQNGDLGIIPGSMGAKSFIVRGKGNRDSFHSCSHGAGRRMGRKEAIRNITLEDFNAQMGTIESRRDKDVIDEAPQCYKSIDAVIAAQSDLIDVVHTLRQVLCVKG